MDTFAPEFSRFWIDDAEGSSTDHARDGDDEASLRKLEELSNLVSAARSIV